jgi:hypothetical protein
MYKDDKEEVCKSVCENSNHTLTTNPKKSSLWFKKNLICAIIIERSKNKIIRKNESKFIPFMGCHYYLVRTKLKLLHYNTSDYTPVWELPDTDNFHKIRPFQLTDQEGKMFSEEKLERQDCCR